MALTTLAALLALLETPLRVHADKVTSSSGHNTGGFSSYWLLAGGTQWPAGVTPPTGVGGALTRASTGAFPLPNPGAGNTLHLAGVTLAQATTSGAVDQATRFYDRLVHTSGLSANISTLQSVNTAALPRHTSGVGVEMYLEIYTTLGATSQTATVDYTNHAGVAKQTTVPIGGTGAANTAVTMLRVPLAVGDLGVRSVESVTLSAGTGVAGDFGVTLAKPLWMVPLSAEEPTNLDWADIGLPVVDPDACVSVMGFQSGERAALSGHLDFIAVA